MTNEMIVCNVFDIEVARKARQKYRNIQDFLSCEINEISAKLFVKTLFENEMVYYFEDDAQHVLSKNNLPLFSYKQALLLNIIKMRFQEKNHLYSSLFEEVENTINLKIAN